MKRKLYFFIVGLIALFSMAACGNTSSESSSATNENTSPPANEEVTTESTTIAIGHGMPENSHYHSFAAKFKEIVEEESNGQLVVEIHPNSVLGAEREMVEGVQLGTLDAVVTSTGPLGNFASISNVFDFPYLFKDKEHAKAVLDGEIGNEITKEIETTGLKVLAWGENGFKNITNNSHPISTPEDLEGIKIRTQENKIQLETFKQYGADPTPMAFSELFTAMQQGVVDGQENPISVIVPSKYYEVQKYLTLSNHFYSPAPFIINQSKFEGLSPELQEVVKEAAFIARDFEREYVAELEAEYLQTAKDEGMEIITNEQFDYEAFVEASQPVYEMYEEEYGELLQKIREAE